MPEPPPVTLLAASPLWDGLDAGTLVVACSGGRDSVALALAASELLTDSTFRARFAKAPRLVLWHLDHGLRADSGEDRAFVEQLGRQLDVPVLAERLELAEQLQREGGNAEHVARRERYARLERLLAEPPADSPVRLPVAAVTGHHRDDQAETVLFRLVRGTHLRGLRGIVPRRAGPVYRPWLKLPRAAVEEYLELRKQPYRDDPTNRDIALARNRLRHVVLPELTKINPRALEHLVRLADIARTAQTQIESRLHGMPVQEFGVRAVNRWLPLVGWPAGDYWAYRLDGGWHSAELLAAFAAHAIEQELGVLNAAEHDALAGWAVQPEAPLELRTLRLALPHPEVLALSGSPEQYDLPPALQLEHGPLHRIGGLAVGLTRPERAQWEQHRKRAREPWELIRSWPAALAELTAAPPATVSWRCFLPAAARLPLTLRAYAPGDRYELPGGGSKKLGDVFTDAKVPAAFRPVWAVLVDADGAVLWVPGLADSRLMQLASGEAPAHLVVLRESR